MSIGLILLAIFLETAVVAVVYLIGYDRGQEALRDYLNRIEKTHDYME